MFFLSLFVLIVYDIKRRGRSKTADLDLSRISHCLPFIFIVCFSFGLVPLSVDTRSWTFLITTLILIKTKTDTAISASGSHFSSSLFPNPLSLSSSASVFLSLKPLSFHSSLTRIPMIVSYSRSSNLVNETKAWRARWFIVWLRSATEVRLPSTTDRLTIHPLNRLLDRKSVV